MARKRYSGAKVVAMLEGRHGDRDQLRRWLRKGDGDGENVPVLADFSLRDLAESIAGDTRWFRDLKARYGDGRSVLLEGDVDMREAGTPVKLSDFKDITGQLLFNQVREGFQHESFKFSDRTPVFPSKIAGTEKVPEISRIGDEAETVLEGEEYPTVGFGSNYYTLPAGVKKGLIVDVSEEAIFFDLTGNVVKQASKVGQDLGFRKEKRLIDTFIGQVNPYIRNGTGTNTYLTAGAYVNASVIALTDEVDVDLVEQAYNDILDPDTGEPIELLDGMLTLVCVPALQRTAMRIAQATQVRETNGTTETIAAPVVQNFDVLSSKQLYRRILAGPQSNTTKAKTWWFLCVLSEFLGWKENWELATFMQGPDGPHAFSRDVAMRWKARYRGEAFIQEARRSYRCGDAS